MRPKLLVVLLLLLYRSVSIAPAATHHSQGRETTADPTISAFTATQEPAIQALLRLAKAGHVPIGIVVEGDELCRTQVSLSAENTPASVVVRGIAAQVAGYGAGPRVGSPMIVVAPLSMHPATSEFLQLIDARYAVKGNLQTLATMLWVHVLAILHPQEGSAAAYSDRRMIAS